MFKSLFHFTRKPLPGAGAMQYAYVPNTTTPLEDALGFSQYRVLSPLRVIQQPQISIGAGVTQQGLGGIAAGTMALQSLSIPNG